MKNRLKKILIGIIMTAFVSNSYGILIPGTALDVSGEFRVRYDNKNRGKAKKGSSYDFLASGVDNSNDYFFARTTLGLGYKANDSFKGLVQIRDNRTWDYDGGKGSLDRSLDLYQAWVEIGNIKDLPLKVKLGRQQVGFGSYIIIGIPNYNKGRVFDAGRLTYKKDDVTVELFGGRLVADKESSFNNETTDNEVVSGVFSKVKNLPARFDTELYFFAKNANEDASGGARDIYSVGTRLKSAKGAFGNWGMHGEFIYQFGRVSSGGQSLDQRSFLVNLGLNYYFKKSSWKPKVKMEYYYSPGDSDPNDGTSETFDIIYPGKNHPRAGVNDLVGWRNMQMFHLGVQSKPDFDKKLKLYAGAWFYWLADTNDFFYAQGGRTGRSSNGYGINPGFSSYVGSELAASAAYKWNKNLSFKIEYVHFFVGDYIEQSLENTGGSADFDSITVTVGYKF